MLFFCCLSLMYVRGGGTSRGRFHVVPQENRRPCVDQRRLLLSSSRSSPSHRLGARTLSLSLRSPPHTHGSVSSAPSCPQREATQLCLARSCVFPPRRWSHLPKKSYRAACSPLSVGWFASEHTRCSPLSPSFYSAVQKWVLQKGLSDYPRVLNCVEKNNCTWVHPGPPPIIKVPEPSHTPF